MKLWNSSILGLLLVIMAVMLYWQGQLRAKLRQENQTLRLRIAQLESRNEEVSRDATGTSKAAAVSEEQLRELLKNFGDGQGCLSIWEHLRDKLCFSYIPVVAGQAHELLIK